MVSERRVDECQCDLDASCSPVGGGECKFFGGRPVREFVELGWRCLHRDVQERNGAPKESASGKAHHAASEHRTTEAHLASAELRAVAQRPQWGRDWLMGLSREQYLELVDRLQDASVSETAEYAAQVPSSLRAGPISST